MAPPRIAAVAIALGACWGKPAPLPAPSNPPPVVASKPRGMLLVIHVAAGTRVAKLFWNDLDAGATGFMDAPELLRLQRVMTLSRRAAWFAGDEAVVRISRSPNTAGVISTDIAGDQIFAVDREGLAAITGCSNGAPCQLSKLTDTGVVDEKPVGVSLPYDAGIGLAAWLGDGRLVYQQRSPPTIWYVDPRTDKATRGPTLVEPFTAITDDGSLIAWHVRLTAGKDVVRWKRLRDGHEMSLAIPGFSMSCQFTPVTRQLYCLHAPAHPIKTDEPIRRGRLVLIDPATGNHRELASDLALLDTQFTTPSPDGRYLGYTAVADEEAHRPTIIDLVTGETFLAGPVGTHAQVAGWLAPR